MASESTIRLNVGGTIFETTRSTLTKYDGYFRSRLESGLPLYFNRSNCLYVDRSPEQFHAVLNFLRDGYVPMPDSDCDVKKLLQEAEYYELDGLVHLCGGETSEEWKKANLEATGTMFLKDWRKGNSRGEILYAINEDEERDFGRYCHEHNKRFVVINYQARKWGEILENQHVINMVQKYRGIWDILFHNTKVDRLHYEIYRPGEIIVAAVCLLEDPAEAFGDVCRVLDEYSTAEPSVK